MPRPKDVAEKATQASRSKGGKARAAKIRADRAEARQIEDVTIDASFFDDI